jgi:hypothetical protein
MDLMVFVLYLLVISWWDLYLRTIESPDLLGSLVALACSIYLFHFTLISALAVVIGSSAGLYEEAD